MSWNPVSGATFYQLYENNVKVYSDSSRIFQRQLPVGNYDYKVRACNSSGCSTFTSIKRTVVEQPLGTAVLFSPDNNGTVTNGIPCFSWSETTGAQSYTVQVSSDTNFNQYSKRWVLNDVVGTTQCWNTSFRANPTAGSTPTQLPPETYYWRIRSDRTGESTFSSYRAFVVPKIGSVSWSKTQFHVGETVQVEGLLTTVSYCLSDGATPISFNNTQQIIFYKTTSGNSNWRCFNNSNQEVQQFSSNLTVNKLSAPMNLGER
ncbi:hypothetical protein HJG39_11695 [Alteromonas sp. a30]|nr:hypothetical protein [Alteromonas sp. a30]